MAGNSSQNESTFLQKNLNLEEPVRVASTTRINLEEPVSRDTRGGSLVDNTSRQGWRINSRISLVATILFYFMLAYSSSYDSSAMRTDSLETTLAYVMVAGASVVWPPATNRALRWKSSCLILKII
jgi:hypothetical protein